jgi:DNA processing protein
MAKMVLTSIDILEEYNIAIKNKQTDTIKEIKFDNEVDKKIYDLLLLEALTIDQLIEKLNIDISTLSFRISMMEINQIIKKTL